MRTIASVRPDKRRPGPRHGLDRDSVVSCDNVTTVRIAAVGDTIGLLFEDREPALARVISDAFELDLTACQPAYVRRLSSPDMMAP